MRENDGEREGTHTDSDVNAVHYTHLYIHIYIVYIYIYIYIYERQREKHKRGKERVHDASDHSHVLGFIELKTGQSRAYRIACFTNRRPMKLIKTLGPKL